MSRRLRQLRRLLVYGAAALVIVAGVFVAGASQLLPLVESHPQYVARWLSERSGQPVGFALAEAHWSRDGPVFRLESLRIGDGPDAIEIARAELLVDIYGGLLPGQALTVLTLRGADVEVRRDAGGAIEVAGIGRGAAGGGGLARLAGLGEIRLDDARLRLSDAISGHRLEFDRIDARLLALGRSIRFGAHLWPAGAGGQPLRIAGDIDAERNDGMLYAGGEGLDLSAWPADIVLGGIAVDAGSIDLGLWLGLSGGRTDALTVELEASGLRLRGASRIPAGEFSIEPRVGLDSLVASAHWRRQDDGWLLSVPTLDADDGSARDRIRGVTVFARGDALGLQAGELALAASGSVAMLADALPMPLRRWLYDARPMLAATDVRLRCAQPPACAGQLQLRSASARPAGDVPGISGLAGRLDFDPQAASLALDAAPVRFDAPRLLRAPIAMQASGRIDAWRGEHGWWLAGAPLQLRGADFALTAAGGIELQQDGSRPAAALHVAVAGASVTAASQFWIRDRMPPRVIEWLDRALVAGRVDAGTLLLAGDLDDWPFSGGEGSFEAIAELSDLTLDYQPGKWPRGEALSGRARFLERAMEFELEGVVSGATVAATGTIADTRAPVLQLDLSGGGSGRDLLGLLRASPLQRRFGAQLLGVDIGGSAQVEMALSLPLKKALGEPQLRGRADLAGADLVDRKWKLAFAGATGRVHFGDEGFAAQELRVRYEGQPATLSLAVGGYTSREDLAAEATLRGRFEADTLLARHPPLAWLAPFVNGQSDWSAVLTVPAGEGDGIGQRLRLRSDLVGTALALPAPLRKVPEARMPLDLRLALPADRGGLELRLGSLLRLAGTVSESDGFAGIAAFGEVPDEAAPARGVRVVGAVPVLDAAGWAAFAAAGPVGGGGGIAEIDLLAGELDVLDRAFAETRIRMQRDDGALRFGFDGPHLDGEVLVPEQEMEVRGITARLNRLHWPDGPARGGFALSDPASVPPLHLWIGDLHFGAARLGEARLETYQTPEGMHVQLFESRSPALELRGSGDWTRHGLRERSRFAFDFTAPDLGRMLERLGFAGRVQGGPTMARLEAHWPGPPSAFALERLDGELELSVGKGSIPDLEPGAGRLLGLLSLTEIPRRLSLDFSDFFAQGFSFNAIEGSFVLEDGNAYTENLAIDSPSAEIRISGRTGLKARDYDQRMEVTPRAGSVLPVVGALAGGPAGAAIGAVAQAILKQPMGEMARVAYHVGGSWDAPVIDRVDRASAQSDAPAGPATAGEGPRSARGAGSTRPPARG